MSLSCQSSGKHIFHPTAEAEVDELLEASISMCACCWSRACHLWRTNLFLCCPAAVWQRLKCDNASSVHSVRAIPTAHQKSYIYQYIYVYMGNLNCIRIISKYFEILWIITGQQWKGFPWVRLGREAFSRSKWNRRCPRGILYWAARRLGSGHQLWIQLRRVLASTRRWFGWRW